MPDCYLTDIALNLWYVLSRTRAAFNRRRIRQSSAMQVTPWRYCRTASDESALVFFLWSNLEFFGRRSCTYFTLRDCFLHSVVLYWWWQRNADCRHLF